MSAQMNEMSGNQVFWKSSLSICTEESSAAEFILQTEG